jgi:thiol-disulfide isomerase/thioredoxin
VVKFFAQYCAPCVRTLPEVERVHRARPEVAFIGIDEDDSEGSARALATSFGLTFDIVHDRDNVLSGRFRVSELPMVFVVGPRGTIAWVGNEKTTEADLLRVIDSTH